MNDSSGRCLGLGVLRGESIFTSASDRAGVSAIAVTVLGAGAERSRSLWRRLGPPAGPLTGNCGLIRQPHGVDRAVNLSHGQVDPLVRMRNPAGVAYEGGASA